MEAITPILSAAGTKPRLIEPNKNNNNHNSQCIRVRESAERERERERGQTIELRDAAHARETTCSALPVIN